MPYQDVHVSVENALDMRLPKVRRWMANFFRNPPRAETNDDLAHGALLQIIADAYKFDLSMVNGWSTLLPVTNDPGVGGNGMTDLFAAYIRRLGCGGLVYPSARCDHGVVLDEGRLVDHWGWVLVNYTDATIPTRVAFEEYTPREPREGIYHFAEIESGGQAGMARR